MLPCRWRKRDRPITFLAVDEIMLAGQIGSFGLVFCASCAVEDNCRLSAWDWVSTENGGKVVDKESKEHRPGSYTATLHRLGVLNRSLRACHGTVSSKWFITSVSISLSYPYFTPTPTHPSIQALLLLSVSFTLTFKSKSTTPLAEKLLLPYQQPIVNQP